MQKERLDQLAELLVQYTNLDFSEKAFVSEKGDEADAIAAALNILVEELQASMKKEKKQAEEIAQLNKNLEQTIIQRTEELSKSESLFRTVIEKNADMMTLTGPDGKLLYVSPSVTVMLGFTPAEYFNRSSFEFIHPDDLPGLIEEIKGIMNTPGKSFFKEQKVLHKNGSYIWCEGTITNMMHDPHIGALVSNFRDITQRKEAEEYRKEHIKELEEMMFITSHKVRQPVANILGIAKLFDGSKNNPDELTKMVGFIKDSAQSLENFTEELTTFIYEQKLKTGNNKAN